MLITASIRDIAGGVKPSMDDQYVRCGCPLTHNGHTGCRIRPGFLVTAHVTANKEDDADAAGRRGAAAE